MGRHRTLDQQGGSADTGDVFAESTVPEDRTGEHSAARVLSSDAPLRRIMYAFSNQWELVGGLLQAE